MVVVFLVIIKLVNIRKLMIEISVPRVAYPSKKQFFDLINKRNTKLWFSL